MVFLHFIVSSYDSSIDDRKARSIRYFIFEEEEEKNIYIYIYTCRRNSK
jgi:hypothetical protein